MSSIGIPSQTKRPAEQHPDQMFYTTHGTTQPASDIELKTEISEFHEESGLTAHESNAMQYSESMRSNSSLPMDDGYEGNNENNPSTIENCNEAWIDDEKQHSSFSNNSSNSTDVDKHFKTKSNSGKAQCLVPSSCPSCHRVRILFVSLFSIFNLIIF